MAIHDDLLEAARIDGCNKFELYWRIALPIHGLHCLSGYTTFMGVWEDYLWPLIVLTDTSKFTLMLVLQQLKSVHTADSLDGDDRYAHGYRSVNYLLLVG